MDIQEQTRKGGFSRSIMLAFATLMVMAYIGIGCYLLLYGTQVLELSAPLPAIFGCSMIIYGLFRGYRMYQTYW